MGVVAMKTLKGAKHNGLAGFREQAPAYSQAALKWVLSNPNVSCAVISFFEFQHVDEYLRASGAKLAPADVALLEEYDRQIAGSYCAPHCGACLDHCPEQLAIDDVLRYRMYFEDYGDQKEALRLYGALEKNASVCASCSAPCLGLVPGRHPDPGPHARRARAAVAGLSRTEGGMMRGICALVVLAWLAAAPRPPRGATAARPSGPARSPGRCPRREAAARRAAASRRASPRTRRRCRSRPGDVLRASTASPCSRTTCPRSSGRSATASSSRACASRSALASPTTRRRRSSRRPPRRAPARRSLDDDGGLRDYAAGLPFAPSRIAPGAPDAGLQWFWNVQQRYQAARLPRALPRDGPRRPDRARRALHRRDVQADPLAPRRPARRRTTSRRARGATCGWRAGCSSSRSRPRVRLAPVPERREPVSARRSDDLHAYLPQWRRVRRIERQPRRGPLHAELLRRRGAEPELPVGGGAGDAGGRGGRRRPSAATAARSRPSAAATRASSSARTSTRRRWSGSTTCSRRSTSRAPVWPAAPDRDFGPWGLSFASDRWDFRRALVIEATQREATDASENATQLIYVDLQTLQPLFIATFDVKGEMTNVGLFAGRWSEDRERLPALARRPGARGARRSTPSAPPSPTSPSRGAGAASPGTTSPPRPPTTR